MLVEVVHEIGAPVRLATAPYFLGCGPAPIPGGYASAGVAAGRLRTETMCDAARST
jgi:hypothetical protein